MTISTRLTPGTRNIRARVWWVPCWMSASMVCGFEGGAAHSRDGAVLVQRTGSCTAQMGCMVGQAWVVLVFGDASCQTGGAAEPFLCRESSQDGLGRKLCQCSFPPVPHGPYCLPSWLCCMAYWGCIPTQTQACAAAFWAARWGPAPTCCCIGASCDPPVSYHTHQVRW